MSGGGALVPIELLHDNPANIRQYPGDLTEIAASLRVRGMLQPLVVTPRKGGGFTVLDGHRRLAAARLARLSAVPCLVSKPGDRGRDVALMLAAAMHKQLTPIERARAFRTLRSQGMTAQAIARETGYSVATVNTSLLLSELPTEAQDLVQDKKLTVADAAQLARDARARGRGEAGVRAPKAKYFTREHRLADQVAERCGHREIRQVVGGAGCGECWEYVIRQDERDRRAVASSKGA